MLDKITNLIQHELKRQVHQADQSPNVGLLVWAARGTDNTTQIVVFALIIFSLLSLASLLTDGILAVLHAAALISVSLHECFFPESARWFVKLIAAN